MIRIIFVSVVTVLHLEHSHIWSLADKTNPVCLNPECRKFGDYILNNMDKRVDPCHDFYGYVCNGWEKNHPRPKHELRWQVGRYLRQQAMEKLREILENPKESLNQRVQEAKKLYNLCNNKPYMELSDRDTVRMTILGIQDWPKITCNGERLPDDLPLWMIDNYYFQRTGESAFLGFSIQQAAGIEGRIALHVHPSPSFYGAIQRLSKWKDIEIENYKLFLVHVFESMMPENKKHCKKTLGKIVMKVFHFREQLTEIAHKIGKEKYELMTVKEAQQWSNELTKKIPNARMDWLKYVRVMHGTRRNSHGNTIEDNEVYVQTKYFIKLFELLAKTAPSVIVNHIHLFFAETHMIRTPQMAEWLIESITLTYPPTGVTRHHPERSALFRNLRINRWQYCVENIGMKETLAKLYIHSFFPLSSKATVKEFMDITKELMKAQISSSPWLNFATKDISKHKIDKVKSIIGYPDWLDSFSRAIPKKPYILPYLIDVEYMQEYHTLYVTAASLQIPIFTPTLPYVVNYGATISMLGHELFHVVDEQGILTDENLNSPWWERGMIAQYKKKSKCFIEIYSKLKEQELKKHSLRLEIDESISLAEDMADAMGLKLAYSGFKIQWLKTDGNCPVLPGFEKHGCDRLFFISFANAFCAASINKGLGGLHKNAHTSAKVRVNAAVSNMKEFSEAFKCKKDDRMYVERRCDLWQD